MPTTRFCTIPGDAEVKAGGSGLLSCDQRRPRMAIVSSAWSPFATFHASIYLVKMGELFQSTCCVGVEVNIHASQSWAQFHISRSRGQTRYYFTIFIFIEVVILISFHFLFVLRRSATQNCRNVCYFTQKCPQGQGHPLNGHKSTFWSIEPSPALVS